MTTIVSDEMVEAFGSAFWAEHWCDTEDDRKQIRAALTAALSIRQGGVKALEWVNVTSPREDGPAEPTGDIEAATMIGEYSICLDDDEGVAETPWCCWGPNENIGHFGDLNEAKAAAQADFNTRILSALTSTAQEIAGKPSAVSVGDGVIAALKPFADAVFNDNGDMTVTIGVPTHGDFVRAYFALKAAQEGK